MSSKRHYTRLFGLPEEQLRFFDELTAEQVLEVRRHFTAGLVDVHRWIYAVKVDGGLVVHRERRRPEWEAAGVYD